MKNWLKKYDLLKIVLFTLLLTFILTWIIPTGMFSGGTFSAGSIYRSGLDDLFRSPYYAINYYLINILFFLAIGVFYGVLSKTDSYKKLVNNTVKCFENKKWLFVTISTLIFAFYTSIAKELLPILVFAPFVITVSLHLGLGKIVGVASSFGAALVGSLGTTYGNYSASFIEQVMGVTATTDLGLKFGILCIALLVYLGFMFVYINTNKKSKELKEEQEQDKFAVELSKNNKAKAWPIATIFVILFAFIILGYIDYEASFGVTLFNDFNTWIDSFQLGDTYILRDILGANVGAFGTWDIYIITYIIGIATLIVKLIGHIKFDELLSSATYGIKKMLRPVLFVVLAYSVLYIWYATLAVYGSYFLPTIINWLENLTEGFNPLITTISAFISSIFHVEFAFTGITLGSYFAANYTGFESLITIIFTSINGLAGLIIPTSTILLSGLAYADISYKSWLKYIWKFLLAMLAILILIFVVMTYL